MSSQASAPRQHASTGPSTPQLPEPTHAERVRTLMASASTGTLATVSRKHEGFPFGSLMPYAMDERGRPIFLISNMAMHTQNLKAEPRASLFVTRSAEDGDPLGAARATLVGRAEAVSGDEQSSVRDIYLEQHKNASYWVDFADFSFFRLELVDLYYVGGFGVMGWVEAKEYAKAAVDPLLTSAGAILSHMNADHGDSMILMAHTLLHLDATEAMMTSVDRLGFTLRLKTAEGMKGGRINFLREVANPQQTREVLVEMVNLARAQKQ